MRRLIEKCWRILKYTQLSVLYHPDGFVHVLGVVYLDNPNIKFGRNVTLYPNVHIFGSGKVTLEDNVSIGDGTIICAAQDIIIGKNTMIAHSAISLTAIMECTWVRICVNSPYQYIRRKLERMYGLVAGARFWQEQKYLMVQ